MSSANENVCYYLLHQGKVLCVNNIIILTIIIITKVIEAVEL